MLTDTDKTDDWLKRIQLTLVLGLLAFAPALFGAVRASDLAWVQWGIVAAGALWLIRLWVRTRFRFLLPPITWAILPFLGYAAWRYATADIEFVARQEFIQIALLALLFMTITNNLYNQEHLKALAVGLVVVGTIISMYGAYQWLAGSDTVFGHDRGGYAGRASGTYICPNHYAGLTEMCVPLALTFLLSARFGALSRVFMAYALVVMCVGLAASGSRGGLIAASVSLFTVIAVVATKRGYRWMSLIAAIVILLGGSWLYKKTLAHRVENTRLSGSEMDNRFWLWQAGYKMFQDHPWTGVGPDHFDHRYRAYRPEVIKTQARPGRLHNDYLNTLVDYGMIGLALVVLPIGVLIWTVVRIWPHLRRKSDDFKARESLRSALVLGSSCGLLAILIHSFFDFNLHIPANALIAVVLLAIVASHTRFASSRWWVSANWPLKGIATLLLAGAITALGSQTLARTREQLALRQASKASDPAAAMAAFKRATDAEPRDPEAAFLAGEHLRVQAWIGALGNKKAANEALPWFEKAIKLNQFDPIPVIRYGMCLDWLERHEEALPYYQKALSLDPNYYYTRSMMGWHYFQTGDLHNALLWYNKSLRVSWLSNPDAMLYREIITKKLAQSSNGLPQL